MSVDWKAEINELYEYCDLIDSRGDYSKTPFIAEIRSHDTIKNLGQRDVVNFLYYIAHEGKSECDEKNRFAEDILGTDFDNLDSFKNDLPDSLRYFMKTICFTRIFSMKEIWMDIQQNFMEFIAVWAVIFLSVEKHNLRHMGFWMSS